jgi:hypothetical protein
MALTDQVVVSWVVTSSSIVGSRYLDHEKERSMLLQIIVVQPQVDTVTQPRSILTLRMQAMCASEILVSTYKTTWCHSPEDHNLRTSIIFALTLSS